MRGRRSRRPPGRGRCRPLTIGQSRVHSPIEFGIDWEQSFGINLGAADRGATRASKWMRCTHACCLHPSRDSHTVPVFAAPGWLPACSGPLQRRTQALESDWRGADSRNKVCQWCCTARWPPAAHKPRHSVIRPKTRGRHEQPPSLTNTQPRCGRHLRQGPPPCPRARR